MQNKYFVFVLLAVILYGCTSPVYLPRPSEVDVNEYGSNIKIIRKAAPDIHGELIAIDHTEIVVLPEYASRCEIVYLDEVKRFSLRYSKPSYYGWTIPFAIFLPFIHGWYSIFSIPVQLIVTVSETVSGMIDFKYSSRNMTYEKLAMFARFPQGIPSQIDLKMIR
jgi:hypothetical protein